MGSGNGRTYLGMRGNVLQVSIGLLAGLDFLLFGYDQGVMGGLLDLTSFSTQFPSIEGSSNSAAQGWSNSPIHDQTDSPRNRRRLV